MNDTSDHNSEDDWLSRRSSAPELPPRGFNSTDVDSQYQRDRARIIHSASFRALQSKTQVLGLGESDFYRTRLTHSLEVAQIGSGICEWLRNKTSDASQKQWIPSFSLIEAICLSHDLGHSPFGHGGEVAMNYMMRDAGGFEANAQTLRILAKLGEYSPHSGLDLTRRTTLGTLKYPVFYSETCQYPEATKSERNSNSRLNIDRWSPPKCLYNAEAEVVDWVLAPFSDQDITRFRSVEECNGRHHRSIYKSFDTSIMELADDIAYGVHDLEDALALGLVEKNIWLDQVAQKISSLPRNPIQEQLAFFNEALFSGSDKQRKHAISKLVGYLISQISIKVNSEFSHPLLKLQAYMQDTAFELLHLLKDFVMQEVILRPELQTLQYKGQQVIIRLFEIYAENPERLLPRDVLAEYRAAPNPASALRSIADFIAAMTDVSAGKLYHKLLSPTAGSIFDRT